MRVSLFSQSLFSLALDQAIAATARLGFDGLELACQTPHLGLDAARKDSRSVARRIERAGLKVSALSLFNTFTNPDILDQEIGTAIEFMQLAPLFDTKIVKMTPGVPSSPDASEVHWRCLERAVQCVVSVARDIGVQVAFETHMRQLSDTLSGAERLLSMASSDSLGLTLDFSNMASAGEEVRQVTATLKDRILNTHLKNGHVDPDGGWVFQPLDSGLTDYSLVLGLLREIGYTGYLTLECLGSDARDYPARTARRDLEILRRLLQKVP